MRRMFVFATVGLIAGFPLSAQLTDPRPTSTYKFTVDMPVTGCTLDGSLNTAGAEAPAGSRFLFLQPTPNQSSVVIQFLTWSDVGSSEYATFNRPGARASGTTGTFFCVARSSFDKFTERVYDTGLSSMDLAVGVLVLPLKLRPGTSGRSFDYSKDITFGTTAGPRWRLGEVREVYGTLIGGIGLSSASLTSANTRNVVTTATDRAAVTWTLGSLLEVDKFQIGAFLGQDRISPPNEADWLYQGKTWFAIGLGYSLFGAGPAKPAQGQ